MTGKPAFPCPGKPEISRKNGLKVEIARFAPIAKKTIAMPRQCQIFRLKRSFSWGSTGPQKKKAAVPRRFAGG